MTIFIVEKTGDDKSLEVGNMLAITEEQEQSLINRNGSQPHLYQNDMNNQIALSEAYSNPSLLKRNTASQR